MRATRYFVLHFVCPTVVAALGVAFAAGVRADTAVDKAGRGLAAMTTGFLELPGQMAQETRQHGAAYGVPVGFVKGLGGIVTRELVGVYEFVTSPIPAPADYRPILRPEYPWGYFDEDRVAEGNGEDQVAAGDGEAIR